MFLKYKQEASGFPENFTTEAQKNEYIQNNFEKEGIKLDKENINYNPGVRSVMKLMLNSFWGRFGMQTNKTKVRYINNLKDWYKMISDDNYIIHNIDFGID